MQCKFNFRNVVFMDLFDNLDIKRILFATKL